MAQSVQAISNQDWTFGDPFESYPWDGNVPVGNVSRGFLPVREATLLRPRLPGRTVNRGNDTR